MKDKEEKIWGVVVKKQNTFWENLIFVSYFVATISAIILYFGTLLVLPILLCQLFDNGIWYLLYIPEIMLTVTLMLTFPPKKSSWYIDTF